MNRGLCPRAPGGYRLRMDLSLGEANSPPQCGGRIPRKQRRSGCTPALPYPPLSSNELYYISSVEAILTCSGVTSSFFSSEAAIRLPRAKELAFRNIPPDPC